MVKYIKQEMPDIRKTGKQQCYYRMETERNIGTKELLEQMSYDGSSLDRGKIAHVLMALADQIAIDLADGCSVTLDGIGTFTAAIGVDLRHEQDTIDGEDTKRNARSLTVTGVNFKADKCMVRNVARQCRLERGGVKRLNKSPYTKEERLQMAVDYLSSPSHPFMRLTDYMLLTGVSHSVASRELKEYRLQPDAKIKISGRGTSIVYVKE